MVNLIPEGMIQVSVGGSIKDKIANIDYTSQGIDLWITKIVPEEDGKEAYQMLDSLCQKLTDKYAQRLSENLKAQRNRAIDNLRQEVAEKYDKKLKQAKELILSQKEEINKLKNN